MAGPRDIVKKFTSFYGLDERSSDLIIDPKFATGFESAQITRNTSIEKSPGYKALVEDLAYAGIARFGRINDDTGQIEKQLIGISDTVSLKTSGTFTVSYSGSLAGVQLSITTGDDDETITFEIQESETVVYSKDLGKAIDETSPVTLAALKTEIDALTDYSATIVGTTTTPAALLPYEESLVFSSSSAAIITFSQWEEVNKTVTSPLAGNATNKGESDFENTAWVNYNGNLYMTNGYDSPLKYDGQTLYKMGLPRAEAAPGTAVVGSGSITDTGRQYSYTYLQVDANSGVFEGQESLQSASVALTADDVTVTVANIQAGSGFNTNCAIVAGVQSGVNTITVDDGSGGSHTMQVGDTAYFFDGVSSEYVEREVTAIAAGTITVDGAAVDVADNAVISNNLRIPIYATTAAGLLRYNLVELPNNSFAATQGFLDDVNVITGLPFYLQPSITPSLPPNGRYITTFQNFLVIGGVSDAVNTVYVGDFGVSVEGFDAFRRSFDVISGAGDRVSGLGANDQFLFVGKSSSSFNISGDMSTFRIRVDQNRGDKGCESHHSIVPVGGYLYFISSDGVYRIISGQTPEEVSAQIQPVFFSDIQNVGSDFVLKRATAINDVDNQKYILFLPTEDLLDGTLVATDASRVFIYDYYRNSWARRPNLNAAAGYVMLDDGIWFCERRFGDESSSAESFTYKFSSDINSVQSYNDHVVATPFEFSTAWTHLGDPEIYKKLIKVKIESLESTPNDGFDLDMDVEFNFIKGLTVNSKSLRPGFSVEGYGLSSYGVSPYGDPDNQVQTLDSVMQMRYKKCFSWRLVMTNTSKNQNVKITGIAEDVSTPYRKSGGIKE